MGISPVVLGAPAFSATPAPIVGGDDGSSDSSGWLSGMGSLFSGIGTAVASGLKAANTPTTPTAGSGWVYNPSTGGYINPVTGQSMTSTGTITSGGISASLFGGNNLILIVLVALVAALFFFKRPQGG